MPDETRIETEHGNQTHEIRTWPLFWEAIRDGFKRFEIVLNRHYLPDDTLHVFEFVPCRICRGRGSVREYGRISEPKCEHCQGTGGRYSGRLLIVPVTYVVTRHRGLGREYAALSLGTPREEQGAHYPSDPDPHCIP